MPALLERAISGKASQGRLLDVAIAGTRGVPARYGGFETFAEELATRLVARGHRVTVYAREGYVSRRRRRHRGVEVVVLPRVRAKHLETVCHAFSSALAARRRRHDVVLLCNAACAPVAPLFGSPVVLNVDGVERLRRKWGLAGRLWYRAAEKLALAVARCVADARTIAGYYRERHGAHLPVIAYGACERRVPAGEALGRLGLEPGGYVLQVARLEPENHASLVADAWKRVLTEKKLVIVGDAPYAPDEKRALVRAQARDGRLVLAGAVYGRRVRELFSNAFAYVQASEVGGTHPALLQGMALAPAVVANDVPEHREVLEEGGLYYARNDGDSLARTLQGLVDSPETRHALGERARAIVRERYSWDSIADQWETILREVAA
ncbi:MAG TPA: glycosyltransferase [Planctomycetota bacterium]|nr:glycosyltransferase [Planctomycetota bacterium]